jgi:hypothetical protein
VKDPLPVYVRRIVPHPASTMRDAALAMRHDAAMRTRCGI